MYFVFFFFQAEDGIRDIGVTGVQTCALPICRRTLRGLGPVVVFPAGVRLARRRLSGGPVAAGTNGPRVIGQSRPRFAGWRSEESRVGKECRSPWLPYY